MLLHCHVIFRSNDVFNEKSMIHLIEPKLGLRKPNARDRAPKENGLNLQLNCLFVTRTHRESIGYQNFNQVRIGFNNFFLWVVNIRFHVSRLGFFVHSMTRLLVVTLIRARVGENGGMYY